MLLFPYTGYFFVFKCWTIVLVTFHFDHEFQIWFNLEHPVYFKSTLITSFCVKSVYSSTAWLLHSSCLIGICPDSEKIQWGDLQTQEFTKAVVVSCIWNCPKGSWFLRRNWCFFLNVAIGIKPTLALVNVLRLVDSYAKQAKCHKIPMIPCV